MAGRRRSWTDEQLVAALAESATLIEVLERLGLARGGAALDGVRKRISELGLDTSHWTGQGWAKGRKNPGNRTARSLDEILVENSPMTRTHELKLRLLAVGLLHRRCEVCGLAQWQGKPIPLQLDHINGRRSDNRLENLRILCANCHAQTDTWCGRNIGRNHE